ncbi:hypothetical protein ACFLQR_03225 [Verrucomicrobiota bacterium]
MRNEKQWFEMDDLKRRDLQRASWISLYRYEAIHNQIAYGHLGHQEEFLGAGAVVFPADSRADALKCDWKDLSPGMGHRPWVEDSTFYSACTYISYKSDLEGIYPVMKLSFDGLEPCELHLHQDIVSGLGLKREGDIWICPEDDYIDVARLDRNTDDESPACLRIRTQYLRDFLCARNSGLLVSTFQRRDEVVEEEPDFGWDEHYELDEERASRWLGIVQAIHEGGFPYGEKMAVFHTARTSVDPKEDVPSFPHPTEDSFESSSWEKTQSGRKLYRVAGEMWRNNWIEPGASSPRIRRDEVEPDIEFIVDSSGETLTGRALGEHRGWVWFKPSVVSTMLSKRSGILEWYTENTGKLGSSSVHTVHFGVNDLGLINVLTKDIAFKPELHQRIWVSHNVLPDGGISHELYMSQMRAEPAETEAPEHMLRSAIQHLRHVSEGLLGQTLLAQHGDEEILLRNIHRFRGDSMAGLFALAKDLTKVIIEQLNQEFLRSLCQSKQKNLGSIKRLERFIDGLGYNGREITAPLVGVYELRHGDAHLSSTGVADSLQLLTLIDNGNYQKMAKKVIEKVAFVLGVTGDLIIKEKQTGKQAQQEH